MMCEMCASLTTAAPILQNSPAPKKLLGDPAGVSKHPPNRNGSGFADARQGQDTYPPLSRLRREYAPFMSDDRCVPAGPPTDANSPTNKIELHPIFFDSSVFPCYRSPNVR